ncbi:MAG: DNA gyrase inhibitor YacG [Candidatus Thiodiazotropha sp.]
MSSKQQRTVPCPTCGKSVVWSEESPWRPFCSERCRLIDLGDWFDENHRISEPMGDHSEDETGN